MKTSLVLLALFATAPGLIFAATANTAPAPAAKSATGAVSAGVLQIAVNAPHSLRPFFSDNIAQAFADRATDAMREQGAKTTFRYLCPFDDPVASQPLLTINLIEWRTDPIGIVDCTFTAMLTSPKGEKDLGVFTGTSMPMGFRFDPLARSDQFDDAARNALDDLYRRIAKTQLLAS